MATIQEAVAAAQANTQNAANEQAASFRNALQQSTRAPVNINPILQQAIVDSTYAAQSSLYQVFIGAVPAGVNTVALAFVPTTVGGQMVYSMEVYTP